MVLKEFIISHSDKKPAKFLEISKRYKIGLITLTMYRTVGLGNNIKND